MTPKPRPPRRNAAKDKTSTPRAPKTTGKLTKDNLKSHMTATRRGEAQRRGRASMSPSPDLDRESLSGNSEERKNEEDLRRNLHIKLEKLEKNNPGHDEAARALILKIVTAEEASKSKQPGELGLQAPAPVERKAMNGISEAVPLGQEVVKAPTKDNLKSLATAVRRGEAQRRGPSSASPSPVLHDDDSLNSEERRNQDMLHRNRRDNQKKKENGPVDNTVDLIKAWCQENEAVPWGITPSPDMRLQVPVHQTAMNRISEVVSSRQEVVQNSMVNGSEPARRSLRENEAAPWGLGPEEQERDFPSRDLEMMRRNKDKPNKQAVLEEAKMNPLLGPSLWGALGPDEMVLDDTEESESSRGPWKIYEEPKSQKYARKAKAAAIAEAEEARKKNKPIRRAANQKVKESASRVLPPDFPVYRATSNLNEVAAFLANASCFISLGGRPSGDLKYTIIAVPSGEEELLLGRHQPAPEDAAQREAFLDAISDARRAYNHDELDNGPYLHDVDNDSEEFARHRIGDDFSDVPFEEFQGAEKPPLSQAESIDSDMDAEETVDDVPRKRRRVVKTDDVNGDVEGDGDDEQTKTVPIARRTPRKSTNTTLAKGAGGRPTRNNKGAAAPKDEADLKPKVGRPAKKEPGAKKRGRAANG